MANENSTQIAGSGSSSGSGLGLIPIILVASLIAACAIFGYEYLQSKKAKSAPSPNPTKAGKNTTGGIANISNSTDDIITEDTNATPSENNTGDPIRTDFDTKYDYQKQNGIWFTRKKGATDWISLADPEWAAAVAKLNAKYPND